MKDLRVPMCLWLASKQQKEDSIFVKHGHPKQESILLDLNTKYEEGLYAPQSHNSYVFEVSEKVLIYFNEIMSRI